MKTQEAKFLLLFQYGKRCGICGKKIKNCRDVTVDHIIPVNRGGKNVLANYQLAHEFCNVEKGDLMPEELAYLRRYKKHRCLKAFLERIFLRRPKVIPPEFPSKNP